MMGDPPESGQDGQNRFFMRWQRLARQLQIACAAALGGNMLAPFEALAAEFCVTCDAPSAHYNCVLPGPAADPSDTRLKLWCITELAKAGNHASCAVDRQQQTPCNGAVKNIALPEGFELGPAPSPAATTTPATPPLAPAPNAGATNGPPAQTVIPKPQVPAPPAGGGPAQDPNAHKQATRGKDAAAPDTAGEAAETATSTLDKAGKAVGDAAQKTWTCITSLFGDC